jgi:hypothetical protein
MRLADQYLLAQIREKLLSHIPDDQWRLVEEEVDKAGGVRRVGGYTGVLLTDAISKASFGGDRSAAGRYAAEQRWKGHQTGGGKDGQGKAGSESARYKKLMERHRSIGRDIEYSKEQLNRTADMMKQATDDKTREQAKDAYSRLEKLVGNLRIKQEMVARMIRKEFPETVQGVLRDEKIRGDTQIVRSEPKGSAKFNSGKKMMLDSLRREFYPKVNAALAKDPEKIKANYEKEIQRKEKDLDRLRAGKTNFGEFNTLNPRKATIGKRIKEIERQIEGLKGELAGIDEYLDETSPGFFSS